MRILYYVIEHLNGYHGASKHVLGFSGAVASHGVPVRILCASDGLQMPLSGVETFEVAKGKHGGTSIALAMSRRARKQPWVELSDTVIYTRAHHLGIAPLMATRYHRRPLVVELNGMPEFAGVEHRGLEGRGFVTRAKLRMAVGAMRISYKLMIAQASKIFVNNPEARDYMVAVRGQKASRVHVVPLGYDPEVAFPRPLEECRKRLGLPMDERLVVHVGSLHGYKGTEALLDGFLQLRLTNCSLVFVGDGTFRAVLERRVREAGVGNRVRFVGEKPFDETPLWAGAAEIAVGLTNVNPLWGCCPTKVIEYAACGVPVVANTMAITQALAEVMPIDLVTDPNSAEQVARALKKTFATNPRQRRVVNLPAEIKGYAWPEIGRRAKNVLSTLVEQPDSGTTALAR